MKLPDKFQFRIPEHSAFTHSAKVVNNNVKVKWARGFLQHIGEANPWTECNVEEAEFWVDDGGWVIVDESKKQEEFVLPDTFLCTWMLEPKLYNAKLEDIAVVLSWGTTCRATYEVSEFKQMVEQGIFKILDKKPLTAEQLAALRRNKEINEMVAQLNASIRIAEQTIEHHKRMIASYEQRKGDLKKGLVE